MGVVPLRVSWVSCHCVIVFRECENFSPGYFVDPEYYLAGISWVSNVFLVGIWWVPSLFTWAFRVLKFFSRGYFVDPRFYDFQ